MIGKGKRNTAVKAAMQTYNAVYFVAVGGAAALIADRIKAVKVIAYEDLLSEAIRELIVEDFPAVVANDAYGGDLYEDGKTAYRRENMRQIDVQDVAAKIRDAVIEINVHTPEPVMIQLSDILASEPSPAGRQAMQDIVQNREVAAARGVPMCQDTGMAVIFLEAGQEVHFVGGDLREAIIEGVRAGYQDGYLRKSVVAEPLFERANTGDNSPPVIHFSLIPGDALNITVAAKGFGAENMSWAKILTPAQGIEGVKAGGGSMRGRCRTERLPARDGGCRRGRHAGSSDHPGEKGPDARSRRAAS